MRFVQLLAAICVGCATLINVAAQEVYRPGTGVTTPIVVTEAQPQYTQQALAARIEGVVGLSAVVLANGTMGDVVVTRSLDSALGLDQQAVKAMKAWTFKPGTKDGQAVAVRIDVEMKFTLK